MARTTGVPMGVAIRNTDPDTGDQYGATVFSDGALKVSLSGSSVSTVTISAATATTDRSGTMTTGSTSQQVMAANATRRYLLIENPVGATETLFVGVGITASTASGSISLVPGGSYCESGAAVPSNAINVNAATTGHAFTALEG